MGVGVGERVHLPPLEEGEGGSAWVGVGVGWGRGYVCHPLKREKVGQPRCVGERGGRYICHPLKREKVGQFGCVCGGGVHLHLPPL